MTKEKYHNSGLEADDDQIAHKCTNNPWIFTGAISKFCHDAALMMVKKTKMVKCGEVCPLIP